MKALEKRIRMFLCRNTESFDNIIEALRELRDDFSCLIPETNLVAGNLDNLNTEQLKFFIREHSVFTKEAIHFLTDALICCHDWPDLAQEIQDNINEEKGSKTKNVPHTEMQRIGYKTDLDINTDTVISSNTTKEFISRMRHIFRHRDNAFVSGALIALESTAIPEFEIADRLIKCYANRISAYKSNAYKVLEGKSLTNLYIDGHKLFEIDHEQHLINAVKPYINEQNTVNMIKGFISVCLTMQLWWMELYNESFRQELRSILEPKITEEVDMNKIFDLQDHEEMA